MHRMEKAMDREQLWEEAVRFHGHSCPGLMIGFRAALYAQKLLNLTFSRDEETVCISENDACGVDAIQVVLGCSIGKGNLLFHMRGKQAFSFYNRESGESIRLILREKPRQMTREETMDYYMNCSDEEMFDKKKTTLRLPEEAQIFDSIVCECCGEVAGANWIRIVDGKKICLDCVPEYDRFRI